MLIVVVVLAVLIVAGIIVLKKMFGSISGEMITDRYYEITERFGEIEKKYGVLGSYEVNYTEFDCDNVCKKYEIWYPSEMKSDEKYPLIVITNGSNFPASQYAPFFKHLASWGFIVIGNEDENTRTGLSSSLALDFMLAQNADKTSIFYGKIDVNNIGITGHSQGGVGAINAVTNQNNGSYYTAMFTASATSRYWGQDSVYGEEWRYDVSKVKIPYFMCAGTGAWDSGSAENIEPTKGQGICPLWSITENYEAISNDVPKVMARRTGKDHTDMLVEPDAYMTAWFMYILKDDEEAGKAFFGGNAEILSNENWQDIKINP